MRNSTRPGGLKDEEFQLYRPVVEALVQKRQFKPTILTVFEEES
jgi:hypothetical protein